MATNFHANSQPSSSSNISLPRNVHPSDEFYSIFSEEEVLEIIHALEVKREIPLKYSYKGKGATSWNNFYLKHIIPRWYRSSNLEIDLLRNNFSFINSLTQEVEQLNIIDVGSGNSYPVKEFISKLLKLGKINKYIAVDISEEMLAISRDNFTKWFPKTKFSSYSIDVENNSLNKLLVEHEANLETANTANVFLHLGVTISNHKNRSQALKNFRDSMGKNDLLIFTSESGSNAKWDGIARGGFKYHVDRVYAGIQEKIGIQAEDCELVRKYDVETDSKVANIKLNHKYSIEFDIKGINKKVEISEGEEITIWRHHAYELPELLQELSQAGLELAHLGTNKNKSHLLVICQVASNT